MTGVRNGRERPQSSKLRWWGIKGGRAVIFRISFLLGETGGKIWRLTTGGTGGAKDQVREPDRFHLRSSLFRL